MTKIKIRPTTINVETPLTSFIDIRQIA